MSEVRIIVANGLLYRDKVDNDHMLGTGAADAIARANGCAYAETFIREHRGETLILDSKDRIDKVIK